MSDMRCTRARPGGAGVAEIEAVRRAMEGYIDRANAVADGYRRFGSEGQLMGEHWCKCRSISNGSPLSNMRPSSAG
jgi:hypothetical protein